MPESKQTGNNNEQIETRNALTFKRPIYRILFFAAWIVVLGGVATLVIAANGKTRSRTCKGVAVSINADSETICVEKEDVLRAIEKSAGGQVVQKSFAGINLGALEKALEKNPWIRDAELYFDTKDYLHVSVWERTPVARVFTAAGESFYMDSSGFALPLLDDYTVKLPVVTGFPGAKKMTAKDSLTLQGVKAVVAAVTADAFWKAQVGQIDITPQRKFELVPLVGSHVIKLGFADDLPTKLNNLMVFYKQVLPKAGLAKYSVLDVQFEGQVVAVKKGLTSVVDSIQLQKNITELMKRKEAEQEPEDVAPAVPFISNEPVKPRKDSVVRKPATQKAATTKPAPSSSTPERTNPPKSNPAKTPIQKPNPQKPPKQPSKTDAPKPKAVMPAAAQNEY